MRICIQNSKINLVLTFVFLSLGGCSSIKKSIDFKDYKNIEPFLNDYLNQSYLEGYVEDYAIFDVMIDSIPNDYFLTLLTD